MIEILRDFDLIYFLHTSVMHVQLHKNKMPRAKIKDI